MVLPKSASVTGHLRTARRLEPSLAKAQSPHQVLHCKGDSKDVSPPGESPAHWLHEEAKRRAWSEAQQRDRAASDRDDKRRPPCPKARRTEIGGGHDLSFPLEHSRR
jgi:hypothetical protein